MYSTFNKLYDQIISEMIIVEDFKTAAITWQDIPESKAYIEKFKNELRQKVKSPLNDIEYWVKEGFDTFKEFVDSYKSKTVRDKDNIITIAEENGAEYLCDIDGYELWFIPSYKASKQIGRFYKGKSTAWCISTDNTDYWKNYSEKSYFIFCIQKNFNVDDNFCKVALEIEKKFKNKVRITEWDVDDYDNTGFLDKHPKILEWIENNFFMIRSKQDQWDQLAKEKRRKEIAVKVSELEKTVNDEYIIKTQEDIIILSEHFNGEIPKIYLSAEVKNIIRRFFMPAKPLSIAGIRLDESIDTLFGLFAGCKELVKVPMFDTSRITNMAAMFAGCSSLEFVPLYDMSNVTTIQQIFNLCISLKEVPSFNTSNVTDMRLAFANCRILKTIPLLDTSNVIYMDSMFECCSNLEYIPKLNTSNVTSMRSMFYRCEKLKTIPLLDTSKVMYIDKMFYVCYSLITIPQLDTSNVINAEYMFANCEKLQFIPKLNMTKIYNMKDMFYNCFSLNKLPEFEFEQNINLEDIIMTNMFFGCRQLGTFGPNAAYQIYAEK